MSELEKTIEELEAEVLAELEEAEDPTKKGAAPAEKADKVSVKTPGGEVQDTGKAVVEPDQKDAPVKKIIAKAKEVSGDKTQKGEGKPDKPEKLAAGDEIEHDGKELAEREMPKTKREMVGNLTAAMSKMRKSEMENLYAAYLNNDHDEDHEETEEEKEKAEAVESET